MPKMLIRPSVKFVLPLCLILVSCSISMSQDFGGHPANIQWNQIKTQSFRLIFPAEMDSQANRAANLITFILKEERSTVGTQHKFVNIVFRNRTTISNGFVSYAPFKSAFFGTPPSDPYTLGAIPWMDALTIHEYRHVLQLSNTRKGVTKLLAFAFGDYAWAAASNINIPDWYYEGDAVMAETAMTNGGRGRIPYFSLTQRALLHQNIHYSYMKARNGSLKDLVPNHYPLGYAQINYARNKFGLTIWKQVLEDASKYKGIFYTFSRNLKKRTGLTTKMLYEATYDSIKNDHVQNIDTILHIPHTALKTQTKKNTVTHYVYPYFNEKGTVFCLKSSFKETIGIIEVDTTGKETKIVNLGQGDDGYFTYKNNKFAWTERRYDPRWGHQNYVVIVTYDLKTKKKHTLTHKTKYFSPEYSTNTEKIIVSEVTPNQKFNLKILDAKNGKVLKTLPNPNGYFWYYPKWTENDKIIAVAQNKSGEFGLLQIDPETGLEIILIDFTNHIIASPYVAHNAVFFSASFNGTDNLFKLDLSTNKIFQVSSVPLGAYFPSIKNNVLVFSEFNHMGYYLSKTKLNPFHFKEIDPLSFKNPKKYLTKSITGEGGNILHKVPSQKFEIKKYSKLSHPINIHSWYPLVDANAIEFNVVSENILNTISGYATYRYNRNDESSSVSGNIAYGGLYPIISVGASQIQKRNRYFFNGENKLDTTKWNEKIYNAGVAFPFNVSKGLYSTRINLSSQINYHFLKYQNSKTNTFTSINSSIKFNNFRRQARQNINPRFGQILNFQYQTGLNFNVWEWNFYSMFYFPGLFLNHSFYTGASLKQRQTEENYEFSDNFFYARGYSAARAYSDILKVSFNYQMPLCYPDLGFYGVAYLKRLRTNFFADYSVVNSFTNETIKTYNSIGLELSFDTRLLNLVPFSFSLRESYLLQEDPYFTKRKFNFEILISSPF